MNLFEYCAEIRKSTLTSPDKLVLRTLADYKNWKTDGEVWPSQSTIASDTSLSRRRVNAAFQNLKEAGWLVPIKESVGTSTRYKLMVPAQEYGEIEVSSS